MFTGIIEKMAIVDSLSLQRDSARLHLKSLDTGDIQIGESLAINGVCLTFSECPTEGTGVFWLSAETLKTSCLGSLQTGAFVNCERALKIGDRLSGHWVQGHVDSRAKLVQIDSRKEGSSITFELSKKFRHHVIEKGSIAIDGISLTIQNVIEETLDCFRFGVSVIPHTWDHTNLRHLQLGDEVNVEFDLVSKYVEQLCRIYLKS